MKYFPLAFLLSCAVAFADPPKAVITGPTDGVPGDLIVVDFSESVADKMKVFIEPTRFSDGKPTYMMSDDGKKAYMASRAGSVFRVELLVSNAEGPDRAVLIITIASPTPPPAPTPPTPVPTPTPPTPQPLPVGKFGMAQFTRDLVLANVTADKRVICSGLSGNYGTVATQIAAGTVKSLADANAKLKTMNHNTVGTDPTLTAFWGTNVFAPLAAKQTSLVASHLLDTTALNDLMTLFNEIRDGFAAAGG